MKIVDPKTGIDECVRTLKAGGIVAYPTETFYGLGVDAMNEAALKRLVDLKGRSESSPFPLILPRAEALKDFASVVPAAAENWISGFWPGPLTIVFKTERLPAVLRGPHGGAGFRVSSHPVAAELARRFGGCLTATSANRSGEPAVRKAADVAKAFKDEDLIVLNGGETPGGLPSTVVDVSGPGAPRVLRVGAIEPKDLGL